jgi:hypothetical protein
MIETSLFSTFQKAHTFLKIINLKLYFPTLIIFALLKKRLVKTVLAIIKIL